MERAMGIEPTSEAWEPLVSCVSNPLFDVLAPRVRTTTARTRRVPPRLVPCRSGGYAKSRGNPTYRPCTACGRPGACIRGKSHKYTLGFPGGLDSLPSIAGLALPAQCDPHAASVQLA